MQRSEGEEAETDKESLRAVSEGPSVQGWRLRMFQLLSRHRVLCVQPIGVKLMSSVRPQAMVSQLRPPLAASRGGCWCLDDLQPHSQSCHSRAALLDAF